MNRIGRWQIGIAATLGLVALTAVPVLAQEFTPIPVIKGIEALKVGDKAPVFVVKDLGGLTFDMSQEMGKGGAFMLVFWSIYCEPCREEMPLIEKFHNQYKSKGLTILSINMDGDPFLDAVKGFIKQGKYSFRVLMDELVNESFLIADPYNVAGTPVVYLIDKAGKVSFNKVGRATEEEIKDQIEKILGTP